MKNPDDARAVRSRHQILAGARELLVEVGVDGVTMSAVAARAGVRRATVYNHYDDVRRLVVDAVAGFDDATGDGTDVPSGVAGLRWLAHRVADNLAGDWGRVAASLSLAADRDPVLAAAHADFVDTRRALARDRVRAAIGDGTLHGDLDVDWVVDVLIGPLYYRRLVRHDLLDVPAVDRHVDQVLAALGAGEADAGESA